MKLTPPGLDQNCFHIARKIKKIKVCVYVCERECVYILGVNSEVLFIVLSTGLPFEMNYQAPRSCVNVGNMLPYQEKAC